MNKAILFKILQRQNKFRNPKSWLQLPELFTYSTNEYHQARGYLEELHSKNISFTYPGDAHYPHAFLKMLEPPLFLEFIGQPIWNSRPLLSVVGSRKIHPLSSLWMKEHLTYLVASTKVCIVSGGAIGVDLMSHTISVMAERPTVAVLPSGLSQIQPLDLKRLTPALLQAGGALISEFEHSDRPRKDYYFFRNRLIAAMGSITLIVQAQQRSGTFLTVHHALQNGRPIMVVPTHPAIEDFSGNLILLQDGAIAAYNSNDLLSHLQTEIQFGAELQRVFSGASVKSVN